MQAWKRTDQTARLEKNLLGPGKKTVLPRRLFTPGPVVFSALPFGQLFSGPAFFIAPSPAKSATCTRADFYEFLPESVSHTGNLQYHS